MPLLLKPLAVQFKVSTPSRPHCDALGTPSVFQLKNHETHCLFPAPFQPHVSSDPWPARSLFSDDWPATVDPDKEVHYVVSDRDAVFEPAGGQWFEGDLSIQGGGDQATRNVIIGATVERAPSGLTSISPMPISSTGGMIPSLTYWSNFMVMPPFSRPMAHRVIFSF